jgi:uncharacterized protein YggE
MKRYFSTLLFLFLFSAIAKAQTPEIHFVADTLVVQADGTYESDPDLATLTFAISSQDKDMKPAYDNAAQSAQRIVALAQKNGLKKEDITLGVLTLAPSYEKDRKNRPKSYVVRGQITLRVRDFSQIGPILDGAVQEGIVEFRSLTYSLLDEESAKERAVAAAMHSAVGRATAALAQNGQKLGAVRYANVDVKQLMGVTRLERNYTEMLELAPGAASPGAGVPQPPPPVFPTVMPEKITVSATVQCAFQIQ